MCATCAVYAEPVAPVAQRYLVTLLTRWDVSSIPANGIFLTKKLKTYATCVVYAAIFRCRFDRTGIVPIAACFEYVKNAI